MFSHIMLGSSDIERSRRFYDAVLATLGVGEPFCSKAASGHVRYFYRHDGGSFVITEPIDDLPATVANGSTIAFRCSSEEVAKAFHDVAVANGGASIEDAPGLRQSALGSVYLAYVRDPDGHKLCAIFRP
jgi:catechol 2,3-dioxygenase-like lactoylglutathione lyase family enzyme